MEITVIKQVFATEEVPDGLTESELREHIEAIIDVHNDDADWDDSDYRGKEVYEAYDTYSGCTLLNLER